MLLLLFFNIFCFFSIRFLWKWERTVTKRTFCHYSSKPNHFNNASWVKRCLHKGIILTLQPSSNSPKQIAHSFVFWTLVIMDARDFARSFEFSVLYLLKYIVKILKYMVKILKYDQTSTLISIKLIYAINHTSLYIKQNNYNCIKIYVMF